MIARQIRCANWHQGSNDRPETLRAEPRAPGERRTRLDGADHKEVRRPT
jgi:hypothetical protein